MRSIRSVSQEPAHSSVPEMLIAGTLAFAVLLNVAYRLEPATASEACVSTPANRALVLCSVRPNQGLAQSGASIAAK